MTSSDDPTSLSRADLPADPLALFQSWLDAARAASLIEPTAMALATADADGTPSCRMVLMRGFDGRGFVFHTNLGSPKARAMAANPRAALTWWWPPLHRQVRVEGAVEPIGAAESDAYFDKRRRESQLSAAASPQSQVVASRAELDAHVTALAARHPDVVPRPESWGGLRVAAHRIEFWQGRDHRLHDRFQYCRDGDGTWSLDRLAP